jgi:membrane protein
VVSAVLAALGKFFGGFLPVPVSVLDALNFVISFGGIAVMFALVLRFVPDTRLPWRYLWVGAAINALLFTIGKTLIGLYLGRAAVGSLYGAGGSIVVVIVWTYYSAQLFLFGAEFTWVYRQSESSAASGARV